MLTSPFRAQLKGDAAWTSGFEIGMMALVKGSGLLLNLVNVLFPIRAFKGCEDDIFWDAAIDTSGVDGPVVRMTAWLIKGFDAAFSAKCVSRFARPKTVGFKGAVGVRNIHIFVQDIDMQIPCHAANTAIAVNGLNRLPQDRCIANSATMAAAFDCCFRHVASLSGPLPACHRPNNPIHPQPERRGQGLLL